MDVKTESDTLNHALVQKIDVNQTDKDIKFRILTFDFSAGAANPYRNRKYDL